MTTKQYDSVRVLSGTDLTRRVVVVARTDGLFEFVEQAWYSNRQEGQLIAEGWRNRPSSKSIYETPELAEKEALRAFTWLQPRPILEA